ncbi:MAG: acyltransferase family protein, partial [Devosia sp.]
DFIDALRGIAILLVICVHTVQEVDGMPEPLNRWLHYGTCGVQLFYAVSAFTLLGSWHSRNDGASAFFVRRVFRIAPLFWIAVPAYLVAWGTGRDYWAPGGISALDVVLTLFFLHGLVPRTINSVVPGDWSVADEMLFYAAFPSLASLVGDLSASLAFVAISYAAALLLNPLARVVWSLLPGQGVMPAVYASFWIINQLPVFASGFVAFFAARRYAAISPRTASIGLLAVVAATLLATWFVQFPDWFPIDMTAIFAPLAGAAVFFMATGGGSVIRPGWLRKVGSLSFGMYLGHFLVRDAVNQLLSGNTSPWLWPVRFLLVSIGAFLLAWGLNKVVEQPMISVGRRIASRLGQTAHKTLSAT